MIFLHQKYPISARKKYSLQENRNWCVNNHNWCKKKYDWVPKDFNPFTVVSKTPRAPSGQNQPFGIAIHSTIREIFSRFGRGGGVLSMVLILTQSFIYYYCEILTN